MKKNKLVIIITVVIVIAILGTSAYMLVGNGGQSNAMQINGQQNKTVDIGKVTIGDITKSISGQGAIQTSETQSIKTPVACKVSRINVGTGSQVKKGDALYTLDQDELNKQYEEAKETLREKMKAAGNTAPSYDYITVRAPKAGTIEQSNVKKKGDVSEILESNENLIVLNDTDGNNVQIDIPQEGVISSVKSSSRKGKTVKEGEELFTIKVPSMAFKNSLKEVEEAKAEVALLEKYLKDPTVYAETDGIVGEIKNDVLGAASEKGAEVLSIQSQNGYILNIKITQSELESISLGQEAEVSFDTGDMLKGSVKHINYKADESGNFEISVAIENLGSAENPIYPGVKAKVAIILEKKESVLRVPLEAIKQDGEGEYVMIYTGEDDDLSGYNAADIPMEKRYIERGITNSLYAEVISGVKEGEKVIVIKTSNNDDMFGDFMPGGASVQMIGL